MLLELNQEGLPTLQGTPLFLPPKESAVLALLIRGQPNAVGKDEIVREAWGGSAVSDDSLVRCVSQLRRILPELKIESVYGFGYRLVQPEPSHHQRFQAVLKGPPDVVESYLHAWELAQRGTERALERALSMFRSIVAEYPDYAPARVSLAATMGTAVGWGMGVELSVSVADGEAQLEAAQQAGASAAGIRVARAWLYDLDWRFAEADRLFRAAYAEQPDDAELLPLFGWHLLAVGRLAEAVEVLRRAVALRPYAVYPRVMLSRALGYAGCAEEALREAEQAGLDHPDNVLALNQRLLLQARAAPSPAIAAESLRLYERPDAPAYVRASQPYVQVSCGATDEAQRMIEETLAAHPAPTAGDVLMVPALVLLGQEGRAAALVEAGLHTRCGLLPLLLRALAARGVMAGHPVVQRVHAQVFAELP